jgi:hypothetical protein
VSELNRAWWDERVPLHVRSGFYDVESFKAGRDALRPFELEEVGDVVSAVIDAGLVLELLHEHDYTLFLRWPFLEKSGFDTYRMPAGRPRIPLMYSLRARAG